MNMKSASESGMNNTMRKGETPSGKSMANAGVMCSFPNDWFGPHDAAAPHSLKTFLSEPLGLMESCRSSKGPTHRFPHRVTEQPVKERILGQTKSGVPTREQGSFGRW